MVKKLLIAVALIAAMAAVTQAQDVDPHTYAFGGVRYDDGVLGSYGVFNKISGPIYGVSYADLGTYNSIATEIVFGHKFENAPFFIGAVAGPNADWIEPQNDPVFYLSGSAGGMLAWFAKDNWGLWSYGKYKFAITDEDYYPDGWSAGLGVFFEI